MRLLVSFTLAALFLLPIAASAQGVTPSSVWQAIASGGQATGGNYVMNASIAQPIVGIATGGNYLASFGVRTQLEPTTVEVAPTGLYLPVLSAQRGLTQ